MGLKIINSNPEKNKINQFREFDAESDELVVSRQIRLKLIEH